LDAASAVELGVIKSSVFSVSVSVAVFGFVSRLMLSPKLKKASFLSLSPSFSERRNSSFVGLADGWRRRRLAPGAKSVLSASG